MMRIAYLCADPGVPLFGRKGCSIHVTEMVRAFARRGAHVDLYCARLGGAPPEDLAGSMTVRELPALNGGDAPADRERELRRSDPGFAASVIARGPYDLVYERYSLWSCTTLEHASAAGWPTVLEINAPLPQEQNRHRLLVDAKAADDVARRALSAMTVGVAVSDPVAEWARARSGGKPVRTLPNGVDARRFDVLDPPPSRTFTIGFVGGLRSWHGVGTLVTASARLMARDDTYRLLIVGDGPERAALEARAGRECPSGTVAFTGAVDHAAVPALIASMHVAAAPYEATGDPYFSPLKILEYLAARRPVVATAGSYADSALQHGRTGLIVPPGDAGALASAIASVRRDPAQARRMGERGRALVVATRSWDAVARSVLDTLPCARPGARVAAVAPALSM